MTHADQSSVLEALAARLEPVVRVVRDAPSVPLTTYRVGGPIALLVEVPDADALIGVSRVLGALDIDGVADVPRAVIGRGSNLLVADSGFAGVAIRLGAGFESVAADGEARRVVAGGGAALPVLARQSVAAGLRGLEFYVGIPGSVGGAVRMNAGGHGCETVDVLESARVVTLGDADVANLGVDVLGLEFRRSALRDDQIVIEATFRATPGDAEAARAEIDEIVRWRRANQPGGQNCGSVFVNPGGDAAGRIIEECGLKGRRIGGASVSDKHANFIQADPDARAADVVALIEDVRQAVVARTGIWLRTELRLLGFEDPRSDGAGLRA
jgi:UDP-N-acetylmuramate dehydrogenase